jgi:hypothetical protein
LGEFFFSTGQLKPGTLFDYAKKESCGDAVHDRHEGYYAWMVPQEKWTHGCPEVRLILARNNLLLCLSTEYDESLYEEFDANCCIQVNSIGFFLAIDRVLQNDFTELMLRKVTYYDKSSWASMPDYEDFAGVMKNISYGHQREVRALWEPRKKHNIKQPFEFTPERVNNDSKFLINVSEDKWYKDYTKKECKWLKPKTIFVPEAIKHCTLISK